MQAHRAAEIGPSANSRGALLRPSTHALTHSHSLTHSLIQSLTHSPAGRVLGAAAAAGLCRQSPTDLQAWVVLPAVQPSALAAGHGPKLDHQGRTGPAQHTTRKLQSFSTRGSLSYSKLHQQSKSGVRCMRSVPKCCLCVAVCPLGESLSFSYIIYAERDVESQHLAPRTPARANGQLEA